MRTSCKLTTDVLVVGSGFSGFWAAMTARKHVQDVLIVDKGPRDWGGIGFLSGGDLFAMTPDMDREKLLDELVYYYDGLCDQEVLGDILDESYARFTDYERMGHEFVRDANGKLMGIPQRGLEHVCCFHSKPYGKGGSNFTRELAREVGKRDIRRLGRIMITDVVKNGDTVCGAVGFFAQSGRPVFIEAKAVILGTGYMTRLYPGPTPTWIGNNAWRISLTGDGRMMAYRAGAELMDLDFFRLHNGLRYLGRCGQATWVGVYRDPQGKPIGPFVTKPEVLYGDATPEADKLIFKKYHAAGRGPCYMDGTGISEKDYREMLEWLQHEGNQPILQHMEEDGIDFRKNPIEVMSYNQGGQGKIVTDEEGQASIAGLYAIGDEVGSGISNASVYGWLCGESAAQIARRKEGGEAAPGALTQERISDLERIGSRNPRYAPGWKEANFALQQIMVDYAGDLRSEANLEAGLFHLRRLRGKAKAAMAANNIHELGRSLEVLNLMDFGELIFLSALDRKETRDTHVRTDFAITNPLLNNKAHIVKQVEGQPVLEWRPIGKKRR